MLRKLLGGENGSRKKGLPCGHSFKRNGRCSVETSWQKSEIFMLKYAVVGGKVHKYFIPVAYPIVMSV